MRIGIVGCGLNSDYHLNFARAYRGAEIVGIVDADAKRANACASRHGITATFSNIADMLEKARPEVVHILTPPRTHFALAKQALEAGCHTLVEKPLGLDSDEASELYAVAEKQNVKLCTMHNHLFDPCMSKANALVRNGELGKVIHVESHYGLNTRIPAFRDYPEPNVLPWLYHLPRSVYQDFLPHPLYVLLEYTGAPIEIKVMQKSHGLLPQNMPDEISILVNGEKALGTVTISFAARPHLQFIKIYGTKMMVEIDINTMTTITHPVSSLPKAAQKATYNLFASWQLFKNTTINVINFVRGALKPYQGMKVLIHHFYEAIEKGGPLPVTKEQALLVIGVMDQIWKQLEIPRLNFEPVVVTQYPYSLKHSEKILVTGGTGFLGSRLVDRLTAEGYPVRVLARKLSQVEPIKNAGVEVFYGDVADKRSLEDAFQGIDVVIHAAAGTSGNQKDCDSATLQGTKNILALSEKYKIKKLVYISSCSVYGVADYKVNQVVDENCSLEQYPQGRGAYSASKQTAEGFVVDAITKRKFPIVILRPGTIYGPGGELFTPMMGFSLFNKAFVVIGNGKFELPFVYIDNLIDAITKSLENEKANNHIFNVVDRERITKRLYMRTLMRALYPRALNFYFPYSLLYFMVWCQEKLCEALERKPFLTRYRLNSSQKNIRYDTTKLSGTLEWSSRVSFAEAVTAIIKYEVNK